MEITAVIDGNSVAIGSSSSEEANFKIEPKRVIYHSVLVNTGKWRQTGNTCI